MLQQLAEKREHERAVLRKALEESRSFSQRAEEKLSHKLEVIKENREAHLEALRQRLRQKARGPGSACVRAGRGSPPGERGLWSWREAEGSGAARGASSLAET